MALTAKTETSIQDIHDDLQRELAFYQQALDAAQLAKKQLNALKVPFTRPSDYFAEMVKTDEHMAKVRQRLLDDAEAIKASEFARKQRELKKVSIPIIDLLYLF
jgi:rRNA-processing protein EBP2